jgi:hypothetical protein
VIARFVIFIAGLLGIGVVPFVAGFMALSVAGAGIYGLWKGYSWASAKCETATLKAEIAKLKHEKAVAEAAEAEEDKAKAELETENEVLEKKVSDYADELAKRPDRCAVTDDDLTRMQ